LINVTNFFTSETELLEHFLSKSADAIYIQDVKSSDIYYVNDKFCEMFSLKQKDVLNKGFQNEIMEEGKNIIKGMNTQESKSVDIEIEHNHSTLFIRLNVTNFKNKYIIGVIKDITEFLSIHQTLESTEERLESILQLIDIGIAFIDISGNIFLVNRYFAEILGYSSTFNLISTHFLEHIRSEMKSEIQSYISSPNQSKNLVFEVEIQCSDQKFKDVLLSLGCLNSIDGTRWGSIIILSDISEQIEFEKFRNKFIEITSHELRTPLAIIKGSNELINMYHSFDNELIQELLNTIMRNVDRLQKLIDSVQDVGKIERGIFEINKEQVHFSKFKKELIQDLRSWKYSNRVVHNFIQDPSKEFDGFLLSIDSDRITQAIFNILENACKYSTSDVKLAVNLDMNGLSIIVEDFGEGISKEIAKSDMKPFSSKTTSIDTGGLGLGLFIVRYIVDQHQGNLIFHSKENEGTKVEILIPNDL